MKTLPKIEQVQIHKVNMKTLSKIEKVRRWLKSGKSITVSQSISHFNYQRLADAIYKLKDEMWIIDIGKPGKFAKYIMVDKGPIKNMMIKGHRIEITGAHYINGRKDMEIQATAFNGVRSKEITLSKSTITKPKEIKKLIDG